MPTPQVTTGDERIPSAPPVIAPVAPHVRRPLWSVMIPTYNCLLYVREALESVLAQDPGPEQMQIQVVDDCSTDGDVEAVVQAVGQGRVEFFRQDRNRGSLRNFETCLNRAVGQRVHLLHGDDRVMPGFYAEIDELFRRYPEAGAALTNVVHIRMSGEHQFNSEPLMPEAGLLDNFLVRLAKGQLIQPPAIVVKRSVYEHLGGFFAVHYGEDWEMWTRIAAHYPIAYSPKPLAHYRYLNSTSITLRSLASGQNVRDIARVIDIIQDYLPPEQRNEIRKIASRHYSFYSVMMAHNLYSDHPSATPALMQAKEALKLDRSPKVLLQALKLYAKNLLRYKQLKQLWQKTTS